MIFDTHCHYNLEPLFSEWTVQWQRAQEADVHESVVVGTDLVSSQHAQEICSIAPNLFAAVGIHPEVYQQWAEALPSPGDHFNSLLDQQIENDRAGLEKLLTNGDTTAIGETGVDFFRLPKNERTAFVKEAQLRGFEMQLQLAKKYDLPVLLHVRDQAEDAYWQVLELLKKHQPKRFVLHCVSGPVSYVQAAVKLGGHVGVAGNVTYRTAQTIRDIVAAVPIEQLLLETDAPFLPPQQYRGQKCEPWMISLTEQFLSQELQLDTNQLYLNAKKLFLESHA